MKFLLVAADVPGPGGVEEIPLPLQLGLPV